VVTLPYQVPMRTSARILILEVKDPLAILLEGSHAIRRLGTLAVEQAAL